jgi:hypothetical protein
MSDKAKACFTVCKGLGAGDLKDCAFRLMDAADKTTAVEIDFSF